MRRAGNEIAASHRLSVALVDPDGAPPAPAGGDTENPACGWGAATGATARPFLYPPAGVLCGLVGGRFMTTKPAWPR